VRNRKTKRYKRIFSEVTIKVRRYYVVSPEEEDKERLRWEGFAEYEGLSLEWKNEWVMKN